METLGCNDVVYQALAIFLYALRNILLQLLGLDDGFHCADMLSADILYDVPGLFEERILCVLGARSGCNSAQFSVNF